jgi:VanZ family protein
MRKIPIEIENPLDNIIYKNFIENTHQYLKYFNLTPNVITIISLVFGLLSAYQLYNKNYQLASVLFIISYILDCMDGYYARTYNMTTSFGDKLDHFSDTLKLLVLLFVMYKLDFYKAYKATLILFIFFVLMSIHLGCQQHYYNDSNDDDEYILDTLKNSCANKQWIHKTRYFGCGTFTFVVVLLILFWEKL